MSYESGTYSDMHDLLLKIKTFLESNGWTVNSYVSDEQGYKSWSGLDYTGAKRLHVQKTAADSTVMYFNLKAVTAGIIFGEHYSLEFFVSTDPPYSGTRYHSEIRGIGINGSTGYDAGEAWDEQPGAPVSGTISESIGACITEVPSSGSNSYYIFQNGDVVVVIAEITTGRYMYLAFGCLTKSSVFTGGQFYSGSVQSYMPSNQFHITVGTPLRRYDTRVQFLANVLQTYSQAYGVYLSIDGDAAWRHCGDERSKTGGSDLHAFHVHLGGQCPYAGSTDTSVINFNNFIFSRGPNHFNGVSILAPVYTFCKRSNLRWSYFGYPEGVRVVNMNNYDEADEFAIGDDTWKVFPAYAKTDELTTISNLNPKVGFAFLKVV